jgi:DNA-directed RNA polymerase subunit K/omega
MLLMNLSYLDAAKERIPNIPLLINVVSRRVRQLNQGQRPLVKPDSQQMPKIDLVLKEIADGKLTAEINYTPPQTSSPGEKVITI